MSVLSMEFVSEVVIVGLPDVVAGHRDVGHVLSAVDETGVDDASLCAQHGVRPGGRSRPVIGGPGTGQGTKQIAQSAEFFRRGRVPRTVQDVEDHFFRMAVPDHLIGSAGRRVGETEVHRRIGSPRTMSTVHVPVVFSHGFLRERTGRTEWPPAFPW
ncbi:hypothetical protein [Streptomyces sp. NPDC057496]|uniref:hypothetical protein n=1 Tax=Streptomyces sp. NPDC057496 TaxID=3346149 RepID=UPI0036C330BB